MIKIWLRIYRLSSPKNQCFWPWVRQTRIKKYVLDFVRLKDGHFIFQGTLLGCFFGFSITTWLAVGAIIYPPDRNVLPVSIEMCLANATATNQSGIVTFQHKPHE